MKLKDEIEVYNKTIDISKDIGVCFNCGSNKFEFQINNNTLEAEVYATSDDNSGIYMGIKCKKCQERYSFNIAISKKSFKEMTHISRKEITKGGETKK